MHPLTQNSTYAQSYDRGFGLIQLNPVVIGMTPPASVGTCTWRHPSAAVTASATSASSGPKRPYVASSAARAAATRATTSAAAGAAAVDTATTAPGASATA